MRNLARDDRIYIAAFVDGEGHIGLGRQVHPAPAEPAYTVMTSVTNTHRGILAWIRGVTGLGTVGLHSARKAGYKQAWIWRLRRNEVQPFLLVVLPHLKIKQAQAELVLEFLSLEGRAGNLVPIEISIQRKLICEELEALNRRGG